MVDDEKTKKLAIWEEFLHELEIELGDQVVRQWVRALVLVKFDARNIYLETSDPLKITWFNEYIRPLIKSGLSNDNGKQIRVHLQLALRGKERVNPLEKSTSFQIVPNRLDPELTFDNFLISRENQVLVDLLKNLPVGEFNPIYIYGDKHTGKTHLLNACALDAETKGYRAYFVRAESFTSHVVQAIRLGRMTEFRKIYRNIDVLCIDGVDFFAKKYATQEEFFHTFNALHTIGKQIIITAPDKPTSLKEIEARLISRFEWGISFKLYPANPMSILNKKKIQWNLDYSDEVIEFLAKTFPKDPLVAMQALALRTKGARAISIEKAREFLLDLIAKNKTSVLDVDTIVAKVATHFDISKEELLGKSQLSEIAFPRQIAMYLCRQKLQMPFQQIGKRFGRDHSTVISSVRQVQKQIDENKIPRILIEEFKPV